MIRAHKIRLNPTPEQANYFARAAGTSRFVWNWALEEWNRQIWGRRETHCTGSQEAVQ